MALKFDASERAIAQSIGGAGHLDILEDSADEHLADLESQAVAAHGVHLDDDLDQTETIKRISDAKFAASFSANQIQGSARRNEF